MNVLQVSIMVLSAIITPSQASHETFVILDSKNEWAIRKSSVPSGTDYGADPSQPYRTRDGHLAIDVNVWDDDGDYVFDVYYKANQNIYIQIDATNDWNNGRPEPRVRERVGCQGDLKIIDQVQRLNVVVYTITPRLTTSTPAPASGDHVGNASSPVETFVIFDSNDEWAIRKSTHPAGSDWGADPSAPYRTNDGHLAIDVNVWDSDGDYFFDVYNKANPKIYMQIDASRVATTGDFAAQVTGRVGCQGDMKVVPLVNAYHIAYVITPSLATKTAALRSEEATGLEAPAYEDHDENHLPSPTFAGFTTEVLGRPNGAVEGHMDCWSCISSGDVPVGDALLCPCADTD